MRFLVFPFVLVQRSWPRDKPGRIRRQTIAACLLAVAVCSHAETARADGTGADVAVGYASTTAINYGNDYHQGWLAAGAVYPWKMLGVIAQLGGGYDGFDVPGLTPLRASLYDLAAGPRVVLPMNRHLRPFGQVLVGGIRVGNNYGGYQYHFAWQPGGGMDVPLKGSIGVRAQADWRFIPISGPPHLALKQFRFAASMVLRR